MIFELRQIVRLFGLLRILARHGALRPLLELLERRGPVVMLAGLLQRIFGNRARGRAGQRIAAALSDMGPAFIKLGQMLSTRPDLLGEQVAGDLSRLQDRLAPFPSATARATIEQELGQPVEALFTQFDDQPVSAASIAQVHYAAIAAPQPGGADIPVAVKILRPGIERAFAQDIAFLRWVAQWIERTQPRLRRLRPVAVIETFAAQTRIEMDLRMEAAAADELKRNFTDDSTFIVPSVDWPRTARRVMTQTRVSGIAMDQRDAILAAGLDIPTVLTTAAAIFFKQVFRDGYFHGDQHPGNMIVDAAGRIGMVDFGIMGRLDRPTRYFMADILLAFLDRDYRRLADIHLAAGLLKRDQSRALFAQACRAIGEPIFGLPLAEISFGRLLGQLFQLSEDFDMEVQPQLMLLQKNMMMAEGVSRQLDPSLNIWTLVRPLIEDWMRRHRGPQARLIDALGDGLEAAIRLPHLVRRLDEWAQSPPRVVHHAGPYPSVWPPLWKGERGSPSWLSWIAVSVLSGAVSAILAVTLIDR